jgi:hypothetical protein
LSRAETALRRIVADLDDLGRRFALVGGLAVSVRSEPRLTRDADLAVLVADDRDAEALVHDLQVRGIAPDRTLAGVPAWNRPGSDKTWVLVSMTAHQRFMRAVRSATRVEARNQDS